MCHYVAHSASASLHVILLKTKKKKRLKKSYGEYFSPHFPDVETELKRG